MKRECFRFRLILTDKKGRFAMKVTIGQRELEWGGKYLTELRDCNDILEEPGAPRNRSQEDGYLLIRGFHKRDQVLNARMEFLRKLEAMGRLDPHALVEDGVIGAENKSGMWGGGTEQLRPTSLSFGRCQFAGGAGLLDDCWADPR